MVSRVVVCNKQFRFLFEQFYFSKRIKLMLPNKLKAVIVTNTLFNFFFKFMCYATDECECYCYVLDMH